MKNLLIFVVLSLCFSSVAFSKVSYKNCASANTNLERRQDMDRKPDGTLKNLPPEYFYQGKNVTKKVAKVTFDLISIIEETGSYKSSVEKMAFYNSKGTRISARVICEKFTFGN